MAILTALGQKTCLVALALLLDVGASFGQDKNWTWSDKSGRVRTRAELEEILRKHSEWLDSDAKRGKRADLSGAYLQGADLRQVDLAQALLSGANLSFANLESARMSGADLRNAVLSPLQPKSQLRTTGIPAPPGPLTGLAYDSRFPCAVSWTGPKGPANLAHSDLLNANLSRAHMEASNLESSNLKGAHLTEAFLTLANLSRADMTDASFVGSSAENAVFEWAKLTNTDLTNANLAGVKLCKTVFEPITLPTAV